MCELASDNLPQPHQVVGSCYDLVFGCHNLDFFLWVSCDSIMPTVDVIIFTNKYYCEAACFGVFVNSIYTFAC